MLTQIRNFVVFAFSHQLWKRQLLLVYFGQSNIFQHMHMFSLPTYIHICIFCILGPRWRTLDRVARVNFRREHLEISNWYLRFLDFAVLPLETAVSACLLRAKQTAQVPRSNSSPGRARRTSPCPVCKFIINPQLLLYGFSPGRSNPNSKIPLLRKDCPQTGEGGVTRIRDFVWQKIMRFFFINKQHLSVLLCSSSFLVHL